MSAFTEYKYAKTEEEREEAMAAIISECRRDEYLDREYYDADPDEYEYDE